MKQLLSLFLALLIGVSQTFAATNPLNQGKLNDSIYNYVRNGSFWFAQRQVPGTLTTYSSTGGRAGSADGWYITNENASAQYQRTDTSGAAESGLQAQFYGNFTKITSTGKLEVSQVLPSVDTCLIRGRTVRITCYMKQLVASAPVIRLGLIQLTSSGTVDTIPATFISAHGANGTDPTLGTNLSYIVPTAGLLTENATITGNAASCTLSASWQKFSACFLVPTNCKNLVVMLWSNNQLAATNGFAVSQVELSDSYNFQDYSPESYDQEYGRCSRYIGKTFNVDTGPIQNAGAGTGEFRFQAGTVGALGDFGWYQFPVRMRIAPTVTTYNPAVGNAQVRDITAAADCSAVATTVATETGVMITATGNASTAVGNKLGVHLLLDADL